MTHIFPIYPPLNTTVRRTHFNVYCELFVYVCVSFLSVKRHLLSQTVSVYVCHLIIFKCHVMLGWWRFLREVFLDNKKKTNFPSSASCQNLLYVCMYAVFLQFLLAFFLLWIKGKRGVLIGGPHIVCCFA